MELKIINKIDFFDLLRTFFTDKKKWNSLTQNAKKPHFFLWRRMMSIQYPVQMNALAGLDDIRIMDQLQKVFCSGVYPNWLYTKAGGDKTKAKEQLIKKYDKAILDKLMEIYNIEWKLVLMLEELAPDVLVKELDIIDSELNPKTEKAKGAKRKKKTTLF